MARAVGARVSAKPLSAAVASSAVARTSAADRKRAEALLAEIRDREARVVRNFYEMGVALKKLKASALHRALGHASFDVMLRERKLMSRTKAYKLIQVAEAYPRAQAVALGFERAYGLLEWARQAPSDEAPASLAARNVQIAGRPVKSAPVRAIKAETKKLRAQPNLLKVDRARDRAQRVAERLARALHGRDAGNARARAVRDGGRWRIEVVLDVDDALTLLG